MSSLSKSYSENLYWPDVVLVYDAESDLFPDFD